jgi:pimeloyl-ACP methyl ester carboxylesterase
LKKTAYDLIKHYLETDFSKDLGRIFIPVLVLHGDNDPVVPFSGWPEVGEALASGKVEGGPV